MKPLYPARVSLDPTSEKYLARLAESPRTQQTARTALKAFYVFRAWEGKRQHLRPPLLPLDRLDLDVLVTFKNWMERRGYAVMSRDTYIALVLKYLRYAQSADALATSFSLERAVTRHKDARKRHSYPLSKINPELPRVIHYYDNLPLPEGTDHAAVERLDILRARALMHTLYSSAGRVSEVASLSRKDVQDGRRSEAAIVGKGDKERYLFLIPSAQAAICEYIKARGDMEEPLFIYHERKYGKPMSRQSIWALVHETAEKLGVGEVSPHDFRHYRATQLRNEGAPLEDIQEILGHKDISTTQRVYAHLNKEKTRASFDRFTRAAEDV